VTFLGHSLIPHRTGGRVPDKAPFPVIRFLCGIWPFDSFAFCRCTCLGAGRCSSHTATPLPDAPRLNVVAVIVVEKLLCMVLKIDYRDFPEIVPAHISPIVFSTMVLAGVGRTCRSARHAPPANSHPGFFRIMGSLHDSQIMHRDHEPRLLRRCTRRWTCPGHDLITYVTL
jgi:hypothetical protein